MNLPLFGLNNLFETINLILIKILQVLFASIVILELFLELGFVEFSKLSNSFSVSDVALFKLDSHLAFLASESIQVILVLFATFSEFSAQLVDFVLTLFQLIVKSSNFSLM